MEFASASSLSSKIPHFLIRVRPMCVRLDSDQARKIVRALSASEFL